MNRRNRWITIVLMLLALGVRAEQPAKHTFPPLKPTIVNMGPGCRIKVDLPATGKVAQKYLAAPDSSSGGGGMSMRMELPGFPSSTDGWYFPLVCYASDHELVIAGMVIRDEATGEWKFTDENIHYEDPDDSLDSDPDDAKLYQIKTVNAAGWAIRIAGAPAEHPPITLLYCALHGQRAVCGDTTVGWQRTTVKTVGKRRLVHYRSVVDHTLFALEIINSIEFLEDAPPDSAQPLK